MYHTENTHDKDNIQKLKNWGKNRISPSKTAFRSSQRKSWPIFSIPPNYNNSSKFLLHHSTVFCRKYNQT